MVLKATINKTPFSGIGIPKELLENIVVFEYILQQAKDVGIFNPLSFSLSLFIYNTYSQTYNESETWTFSQQYPLRLGIQICISPRFHLVGIGTARYKVPVPYTPVTAIPFGKYGIFTFSCPRTRTRSSKRVLKFSIYFPKGKHNIKRPSPPV